MPHDVFISYAHLDNELELPQESVGWVTSFYQSLKFHLGVQLGRAPEIWMDDKKMHGGDFIDGNVFKNLHESSTLVCIISPSYINSRWCPRELQSYRQTVGYRLNEQKSRVFFVVKNPGLQPPADEIFNDWNLFRNNFYEERSGIPRTLSPKSDPFKDNVVTLAYQINEVISLLETEEAATSTRKTIYLSETTRDLREQYERIRKDLNRTYNVLPKDFANLPGDADGYQREIREQLKKCELAVHLVGNNYGDSLKGSDLSFVQLQTKAAVAHSKENPDFSTLIWIPEGVEPKKEFLDDLVASASKKVDIFRDPSEEKLKTRIQDILEGKLNKDSEPPVPPGRKYVYVYCEKQDAEAVRDLEDILFDEFGCEIYSASDYLAQKQEISGEEDFLREVEKYVKKSHGVVVYWGSPVKYWVQASIQILRESVGEKPLGVFLVKQEPYRTRDAKFINNHDALREFITNLNLEGNGNAAQ